MSPESGSHPKRHRSPKVTAFGQLLKQLREKRFPKWAPETVAQKLMEWYPGVETSGPSLRGYELGWNKSMDPVVLAALASAYQFPLRDLIRVLAENRQKPEMADFEVELVLREGRRRHESEAAATARFAEIGPRLRAIGVELIEYAIDADTLTGEPGPADDGSGESSAEGGE
jgi:hypothetical protein